MLKSYSGWWWVAYSILVSAQGPLVLVLELKGFRIKGLGPGLDNKSGRYFVFTIQVSFQ